MKKYFNISRHTVLVKKNGTLVPVKPGESIELTEASALRMAQFLREVEIPEPQLITEAPLPLEVQEDKEEESVEEPPVEEPSAKEEEKEEPKQKPKSKSKKKK